jgi:hypothetical protein
VALSLNIDPRKLRHHPDAWMTGGPGRPAGPVFLEHQEFQERWLVAQRSLGSTFPGPVNWPEHRRGSDPEVRLDTFARWARSLEWEFPAELSQLAGDAGQFVPSATTEPARATNAADLGAAPAAVALWEAELRKPWPERQYFHIAAVTLRLSRKPGRLETDEEEAHRILLHLIASSDRGEFGDDELVVLVDEAPHIVPAKARLAQEYGSAIPLLIWCDAVLLARPAVERFLRGCGLAGAPRLLAEWGFGGESEGADKPEPAPAGVSDAIITPASPDKRAAYETRVTDFRKLHDRDPPIQTTKSGVQGDREWAVENRVSRPDIEKWRGELLGPQLRGRPRNSPGNSPEQ